MIDGNHGTAFPTTAIQSITWLSSLMTHVSSDNYDVSFWIFRILIMHISVQRQRIEKDGISVDTLAVNSNDSKRKSLNCLKRFLMCEHGNYDALLISHKNKLVFESYYKKGRINVPHGQASAVKAYTSLVLE